MLADFAHNPHGLKLLCDFVSKLDYPTRIGVISGTGDRRDEDIRELGEISANYFDEIIIRQDKHLRGRTAEEIVNLLVEGINATKTKDKFDLKPIAYHERVRNGFQRFAKEFGNCKIVDANRTPEDIHADIWAIVSEQLHI